MKRKNLLLMTALLISGLFFTAAVPYLQNLNPDPPDEVVKLIFIHHSTGENWLADGYGDLGRELGTNNYFVSDIGNINRFKERDDQIHLRWLDYYNGRASHKTWWALPGIYEVDPMDIQRLGQLHGIDIKEVSNEK